MKGSKLAVRMRGTEEGHGPGLTEDCYIDTFLNHAESLYSGPCDFASLTLWLSPLWEFAGCPLSLFDD